MRQQVAATQHLLEEAKEDLDVPTILIEDRDDLGNAGGDGPVAAPPSERNAAGAGLRGDSRPEGPVVLLTFGGPGTSTQTVAYFLWEQVWVFNKFSFGAAASILLLFIFSILIFFGVYMLISQRRAVEGSAP